MTSSPGTDLSRIATSETQPAATPIPVDHADLGHDELVLLAGLSTTNTQIANYIARVLDLDQRRTEYAQSLVQVEQDLAETLLAAGKALLVYSRRPGRPAEETSRAQAIEDSNRKDPT